MIGTYDAVYGYNKNLTKGLKEGPEVDRVSAFLDVFFRLHINNKLGIQRNAIYSPAPQRAIVARRSEVLFRNAVEMRIREHIEKHSSGYMSQLLKDVLKNETIPLPMFAIHFLRSECVNTPLEMIESAQRLRDTNSDVQMIRSWLAKWEILYSSPSGTDKEKARKELDRLSADLGILRGSTSLFSVVRCEGSLTLTPDGTVTGAIGADVTPISPLLRKLYLRFKGTRVFLSALRQEFEFEGAIGTDVCRMLGRPIVL